MNSFTIILSKFINNIIIEDNKKIIHNNYYEYLFLQQFDNKNVYDSNLLHYITHKYDTLKKQVLQSYFLNDESKDYYLNIFYNSQKIYNLFSRAARKYKIKKSIKFDNNNSDLCLNDISDFSNDSVINIYIDLARTTYTFRISDIIQITNTALTYSPGFFAEPHHIKNPYTNVVFTCSELYSIYFKIKNSNFIMPQFFHQYFLNNFNLISYTIKNETLIREEAIKSFTNNATMLQKYKYIMRMIVEFNDNYSFNSIDKDFPKKKLVDAFSFLLNDYLTYEFSLISSLRKYSKLNIKHELSKFKRNNPTFGRKIIIKKYNYDKTRVFIFGKANINYIRVYKFIDTVNKEKSYATMNRKNTRKSKNSLMRRNKRDKKYKRPQYTYDLDKFFTWKMDNIIYKHTLFYTLITKLNNNFTSKINILIADYCNVSSFNVNIVNTNILNINYLNKDNLRNATNTLAPTNKIIFIENKNDVNTNSINDTNDESIEESDD